MRASQPHPRATAPNRSKRSWMPAESQTFTSGLFTLLKPPWPTSSCERNVVRRRRRKEKGELRIEAVIDSIRAADVTGDPNAAPSRAEADPRHNLERIVGGARGGGRRMARCGHLPGGKADG